MITSNLKNSLSFGPCEYASFYLVLQNLREDVVHLGQIKFWINFFLNFIILCMLISFKL